MQDTRLETQFETRSGSYAFRALFAAALAIATSAAPVAAQDYPTKNITIIVPFAPGGFVDAAARLLQPEMEKRLGRTIIIDNRLGAGGAVGTAAAVRAEPDGHTLLMVASSHAVAPAVNPKLTYDTVNDLAPLVMIARDPMLFVVNNKVPAKTLKELVAYAKTKPDGLNYSSPGFGSQTHFIAELFNLKAGIKITHVPYRGGGPALQGVVQGDVEFSVLSGQVTLPQIEAGALRALALGGATRDPRAPTTEPVGEAGFPDVEAIHACACQNARSAHQEAQRDRQRRAGRQGHARTPRGAGHVGAGRRAGRSRQGHRDRS